MRKLSKQDVTRRDELANKLADLQEKVEDAINEYNQQTEVLFSPVKKAVEAYNEAVTEAEEFRSDINNQQEEYFGERSENWQEGDAGQQYDTWKDAWGEELTEVEVTKPDDLDQPEMEHSDNLLGLATAPDEV